MTVEKFKKLFEERKRRKSNMQSWAEREIAIACKWERDGAQEDKWDYGCACYESALKAYNSLCNDGHSGFSISVTKGILNRLIDHKPLTPIEDTDDVWNDISGIRCLKDDERKYQCKRMSSLFKHVYADGSVKYQDVDSFYCVNIHNPNTSYHSGLVQRVINDMFPVTMPYYPNGRYKVYCDDLLTDGKNGDFDTVGVFHIIKPDGADIDVNRFFKESPDGWDEIDEAEYWERSAMDKVRKGELE